MEKDTTLNELAYRLMSLYRTTNKDTDSVPIELVKDWIHSTRALLLKQRLSKPFSNMSQAVIQILGSVELEEVDSSIESSIMSEKYMLRTKLDIPLAINTPNNLGAFIRIGPADRLSVRYKLVTYDTALFSGYGKFNSRDIHAFVLDNKIYVAARDLEAFKGLKYLDIHGIFQNPEYAALFANPNWNHDSYYPIDKHLIDDMENIITKSKFPFIMQGLKDPINDDNDTLTQPNPKNNGARQEEQA